MKELDFLPQSFRDAIRRKRQARRNFYYLLALAAALIALHATNASRIRLAEAALSVLRTDTETWKSAREQLTSLQVRRDLLKQRAQIVGQLEDDAPLDAILGEITPLLSPSMAVRSFSLETKWDTTEASKTDAKKQDSKNRPQRAGTTITLTGIAATDVEVGIFFGRLSVCPLLGNVTMSYCRETKQAELQAREFQLSFDVKRIALAL